MKATPNESLTHCDVVASAVLHHSRHVGEFGRVDDSHTRRRVVEAFVWPTAHLPAIIETNVIVAEIKQRDRRPTIVVPWLDYGIHLPHQVHNACKRARGLRVQHRKLHGRNSQSHGAQTRAHSRARDIACSSPMAMHAVGSSTPVHVVSLTWFQWCALATGANFSAIDLRTALEHPAITQTAFMTMHTYLRSHDVLRNVAHEPVPAAPAHRWRVGPDDARGELTRSASIRLLRLLRCCCDCERRR